MAASFRGEAPLLQDMQNFDINLFGIEYNG